MSILNDFQRVTTVQPCPICMKPDWCLVSRRTRDEPLRAVCQRVESDVRLGEAGWLHVLGDGGRKPRSSRARKMELNCSAVRDVDFRGLTDEFLRALNHNPLSNLSAQLGLTEESLERLHVGWASAKALGRVGTSCRYSGAWTFPMSDEAGQVCGIRLRTRTGCKYALRGSVQGLFIPFGHRRYEKLFIAEGPTDTAALLELGFAAIGRPNCTGGRAQARRFIQVCRPQQIVIVADSDRPGQLGAQQLAVSLRPYCRDVRIIGPPTGFNDVRAWKLGGATENEVVNTVNDTEPIQLEVKIQSKYKGISNVR